MSIQYFGLTNTGKRYSHNEDYFFLPDKQPLFFILCDGIGGANAGEVASEMTANILYNSFHSSLMNTDKVGELREHITDLIKEVNRKVYLLSRENLRYQGMGTTLVTSLLINDTAIIHSVGDSRCYRLNQEGKLEQLTEDQSFVWELYSSGSISKEEMRKHPRNNIINMAIGTHTDVKVNSYIVNCDEGDFFLLCSDGLSDMLSDNKIKDCLLKDLSLSEICQLLVDRANDEGGKDNITVVLIKV